jgi:hypothetical protein
VPNWTLYVEFKLTEVKVPKLCSYRKWVVATAKELGLALAGHETATIAQQRRLFA